MEETSKNNETAQLGIGAVSGRRHKWNCITDTCERCGIERRKKPMRTSYTLIVKGMMTEYKVNGDWVGQLPACC